MKTLEERIAIMQAYHDGKTIEWKPLPGSDACWEVDANPFFWDWSNFDYRVKAVPKYRPYANADECLKDVRKHGGWVKDKDGDYVFITFFSNKNDFNLFKRDYVWADDGSPCGVLEEE